MKDFLKNHDTLVYSVLIFIEVIIIGLFVL